ncbi:lasso peptide biosynthesis PqqD family chaperone [Magnetococcales bacterium HHB-1]
MSQTVQLHTVVCQNNENPSSEIDNETILLSLEKGNYYSMGSIGQRVWQLIELPQSVEAVCQSLEQEYHVTPELCRTDTLNFLNQLAKENLILIQDDKTD